MRLSQIVQKLRKEIEGGKKVDIIEAYYGILCENAEELSKTNEFFYLPLNNIFTVVSRIDFSSIDESERNTTLQNLIRNIINAHYEEKETLMILQNIDITDLQLTYEDIHSILGLFTNCQILNQFYNLYKDEQQLPEIDYDLRLKEKDNDIEKLKQQIIMLKTAEKSKYKTDHKEPEKYEKNIFKACELGKLESVQRLIGTGVIKKNIKDSDNLTPLYYACKNGHLPILDYLVGKGFSPYGKDDNGNTLLHIASLNGHLPIVKYLVCKGCSTNAKNKIGNTPLHMASMNGHDEVATFLISKGSNRYAKNKDGKIPAELKSKMIYF